MAIFKGKKDKQQADGRSDDRLVAKATLAKRPDPNKLSKVRMR